MNIIIWGALIAGLLLIYIKRRGGKLVPGFPHLPQINFPAIDYRAVAYVIGAIALVTLTWVLKPWTWTWWQTLTHRQLYSLGVVVMIASLLIYWVGKRILPEKWVKWSLVGILPAVIVLGTGFYISGLGQCLINEICPDMRVSTDDLSTPTVREIAAGSYGTQLAPVGTWSVWLKLPETEKRLCARFVTENSWADDLKVRYVDEEGLPWLGGDDIHNATHISFRSNLEAPVLVQYSLWETAGKCVRA